MRPSAASRFSVRRRTALVIAICASIVVLPAAPTAAKRSGSTQTAQAIWTDFRAAGSGDYGFTDRATYAFDAGVAAGAYGTPTARLTNTACTGGGSNAGQPCNPANAPGAGDAPDAPSFSVPNADRCTFWSGGELSTVTQTVLVERDGLSGSGSWKYTWTFTWDPAGAIAGDDGLDAGTPIGAWSLTGLDGDGAATVVFPGRIAGLSAQQTSKASGPKYSFSMLAGDGTPRVADVTVTAMNGAVVVSTQTVDAAVIDAADPDFQEFSLGSGGLSTLMAQNGVLSLLRTGNARTILNTDAFPGNDDGGSTGAALAYVQLDAAHVSLPEGTFDIILTARVKGIDGSADTSVSVTREVKILGLGSCG